MGTSIEKPKTVNNPPEPIVQDKNIIQSPKTTTIFNKPSEKNVKDMNLEDFTNYLNTEMGTNIGTAEPSALISNEKGEQVKDMNIEDFTNYLNTEMGTDVGATQLPAKEPGQATDLNDLSIAELAEYIETEFHGEEFTFDDV